MSKRLKRVARTFENKAGAKLNRPVPTTRKRDPEPNRDLMETVTVAVPNPSKTSTALGLIMTVERFTRR